MTNHPKDTHISDSASGGKGESMARETRMLAEKIVAWVATGTPMDELATEHLANMLGSECSRLSETPAQSSEVRPGVGTAVESNTADEKGLASRVEELEEALEKISKSKKYHESRLTGESMSVLNDAIWRAERVLAKHSGSLNSADSASNTESSSTAKESRKGKE